MNEDSPVDESSFALKYPIYIAAFNSSLIDADTVSINETTRLLLGKQPEGMFIAAFTERLLIEQFLSSQGFAGKVRILEVVDPREMLPILQWQLQQQNQEVGIVFDPSETFPGFPVSRAGFEGSIE